MSEYDSLGTGTTTSYVYDDVGNRVSKDVNGTAYTYTVDQLNRVTAVSGGSTIAWTYDANGNTATKTTGGVTHTYSYDRENRLADVSTTSGSIFNAVYDYRSRRLEKTENSSTVKYLYDGGVSVQEYDSQGSLTKVLVRGGGIGSVIYTADDANGTNRRFFLYNALGSTSALTNDAMTVTSTSSYDGWGKEVASTGSSTNDRKFCTKERSASIGLDYFGFRYYDYDLGRFSTRDPSGYPDGLNNYLYCNNDPVNKIDPLGLKSEDIDKKINSFEKAEKARYTLQAQMSNLNYLIDINKEYESPKVKRKVERLKFKVDVIKKIMKKDDKRRAEALKDKDIRDYDAVKKLLMAEIKNPSDKREYNEQSSKKGMRAIASILVNRLNYKNKKEFYAKDAKYLYDIIVSRGQFAGVSDKNGELVMNEDIRKRINYIVAQAFTGSPGKFNKYYSNVANIAKDAVRRTLVDPYKNEGGTYFIRTSGHKGPGGKSQYVGTIQGNNYYTLK